MLFGNYNSDFNIFCLVTDTLVVLFMCSSLDVITVEDVVVLCVVCVHPSKCRSMAMIDHREHVMTATTIAFHPNSKGHVINNIYNACIQHIPTRVYICTCLCIIYIHVCTIHSMHRPSEDSSEEDTVDQDTTTRMYFVS